MLFLYGIYSRRDVRSWAKLNKYECRGIWKDFEWLTAHMILKQQTQRGGEALNAYLVQSYIAVIFTMETRKDTQNVTSDRPLCMMWKARTRGIDFPRR